MYYHSGQFEKSLKLHLQCLEIRKTTLGLDHPHTLDSMHDLALLYDVTGDCDKAEAFYIDCITRCMATLGNKGLTRKAKENYDAFKEKKKLSEL